MVLFGTSTRPASRPARAGSEIGRDDAEKRPKDFLDGGPRRPSPIGAKPRWVPHPRGRTQSSFRVIVEAEVAGASDSDLLLGWRAGDRAAGETLMRRHYRTVL